VVFIGVDFSCDENSVLVVREANDDASWND
jgi:hypothetical protein